VVIGADDEWATQRDTARRADVLGFDLVWLAAGSAVTACALASATESVRIGLALTCGAHPVNLAEEVAVADLVLGGRLVLALGPGDGGLGQLTETVEVVLAGQAPRPFAHDGPQWTIPANLPGNLETETRVRVTPTPAQIELPVWITGPDAAAVAAEFGLSYVGGVEENSDVLVATWTAIEAALGPAAARLRRPAVRRFGDGFDVPAALASLHAEQEAWGMDVALLDVPAAALDAIARTHNHTRS
jgi:alkanesulfonate monooxygenase SsuD/methylene tetrahydromethanopterin reductase-like flavin-dependent oxidoreductase (luciferase family)